MGLGEKAERFCEEYVIDFDVAKASERAGCSKGYARTLLEDERAVDLIKKALKDKDEEVVENAVIALYNLEGTDILTEILESENYSYKVKDKAQEILDEYECDYDE